ncbi:N-acyl-D-glucosamine 2-epimerase [Paenibacillus sp. JX-17]|uniref:N-acyl-D-glucosamine 2-epimerase n=1 Tax=Paenibacillus lacisoli TaxID=3064525 RepID=A0ABT9CCX9_9BACL|nr:N-acyl-D-glucosamine 2-epimerase [Paenibacillus sp. JX-17]MDO7907128.1 N-acyl-D-glucosamine 2-epimerase [Paenibacillus sp. JX-17]
MKIKLEPQRRCRERISRVKPWALGGASIQIDPLFPYYADRSADSIAEELELAGYRTVRYFVVDERKINGPLIEACQRRGIAVWAMVLGNGSFGTAQLPPGWESWKMELLKETKDGFQRLSHFAEEYVAWKSRRTGELVARYPFDGIEVAEPYFPEWKGLRTGTYGDLSRHAAEAFRKRCGAPLPEFRDRQADNYYRKVPELYQEWVEMRVDAVNELVHRIINGPEGARSMRPDLLAATWSLAVTGRHAQARLREWQGMDAASMIAKVQPDMHVLQTHWPDWQRRWLRPDYVKHYRKLAAPIQRISPDLPIAIQADIGSSRRMVKSGTWLQKFARSVQVQGFNGWTAYEYHIGGYMYDEPPFLLTARRIGEEELVLSFSKRIAPVKEPASLNLLITGFDQGSPQKIEAAAVRTDGNRLLLRIPGLPAGPLGIQLEGITDTPELWLFKDRRAHHTPGDRVVPVKEPVEE